MPRIEMDFCFFSKDDEKQVVNCLVMLDCESGAMAAAAAPKSVTRFTVDFVEGVMDSWGRTDIILTTDQENAIELLAQEVQHQRKNRTIVRASPRYSPQSKGAVERMNFELEGQVRAFWIDTEAKLGIQLPVSHAALTWVTRHAAWVITR